jgi:hypothetical protein
MYYSYIEIDYVATSFSPARTDLALKLLRFGGIPFSPQNRGWAPQKGGHDPPFKEKRGSCQKNNTKMY